MQRRIAELHTAYRKSRPLQLIRVRTDAEKSDFAVLPGPARDASEHPWVRAVAGHPAWERTDPELYAARDALKELCVEWAGRLAKAYERAPPHCGTPPGTTGTSRSGSTRRSSSSRANWPRTPSWPPPRRRCWPCCRSSARRSGLRRQRAESLLSVVARPTEPQRATLSALSYSTTPGWTEGFDDCGRRRRRTSQHTTSGGGCSTAGCCNSRRSTPPKPSRNSWDLRPGDRSIRRGCAMCCPVNASSASSRTSAPRRSHPLAPANSPTTSRSPPVPSTSTRSASPSSPALPRSVTHWPSTRSTCLRWWPSTWASPTAWT